MRRILFVLAAAALVQAGDNTTTLWYTHPASRWENALPLGNGRLGAMVHGRTDTEQIGLNETTYWSGGPYETVVPGSRDALAEVRRLVFDGEYKKAHVLFGRKLMGYPVEQQKYQALGNLVLKFTGATGEVREYRHELDLDRAIDTVRYVQNGVRFTRTVFVSPVDQVVVVRLTADRPGSISFDAQLRGYRNTAHSNYATDYYHMDGDGPAGLALRGKSADYLGVAGRVRYVAKLRAVQDGGSVRTNDETLVVRSANAVTLVIAAATNFVTYQDLSGDPEARVRATLDKALARSFSAMESSHVAEHQRLFGRVSLRLPETAASAKPTDERLSRPDEDPALPALLFQFGRYLLISSSRPGSQPANLQGIWNSSMNPMWDSKYTTNINLQMNYWPAEVANLAETAEPVYGFLQDLTVTGAKVAREHYGARGWVVHQNTDLWRAAAPMDGASWGPFATGGAWLALQLWEHYRFTGDIEFLRRYYPVLKGSAEFFEDTLVAHPKRGWLVTNPSTSPENFPALGVKFFDEQTMFETGTTICAGSTIDMQIVGALFDAVSGAADALRVDAEFAQEIRGMRARLAPMQVGRKGNLQEWLEDWDETEKSHRHISGLWGVFPGRSVSPRRTPEFAAAAKVVLNQRGLEGNGWSSAWKAASWTRLGEGERALENIHYAARTYTFESLFSICSKALQVDGAFGMTAVVAEMLLQSQDDELTLLPALPKAWDKGEVRGLRARGGFEVSLAWAAGQMTQASVVSSTGSRCRVRYGGGGALRVSTSGRDVLVARPEAGVIEFQTSPDATYEIRPAGN